MLHRSQNLCGLQGGCESWCRLCAFHDLCVEEGADARVAKNAPAPPPATIRDWFAVSTNVAPPPPPPPTGSGSPAWPTTISSIWPAWRPRVAPTPAPVPEVSVQSHSKWVPSANATCKVSAAGQLRCPVCLQTQAMIRSVFVSIAGLSMWSKARIMHGPQAFALCWWNGGLTVGSS